MERLEWDLQTRQTPSDDGVCGPGRKRCNSLRTWIRCGHREGKCMPPIVRDPLGRVRLRAFRLSALEYPEIHRFNNVRALRY